MFLLLLPVLALTLATTEAAITFVAETTSNCAGGAGTCSFGMPAGTTTDDVVVLNGTCDQALAAGLGGIQAGQDWVDLRRDGGFLPGREIAYKIIVDVSPGSVTVDKCDVKTAYLLQTWRGVDLTTPQDVALPTEASGFGDPDSPSATPITANALVISLGHGDDDQCGSVTGPSGYTNASCFDVGTSESGACSCMASKILVTPAPEDPGAWVLGMDDDWLANTLVLRPAGGVGPVGTIGVNFTGVTKK